MREQVETRWSRYGGPESSSSRHTGKHTQHQQIKNIWSSIEEMSCQSRRHMREVLTTASCVFQRVSGRSSQDLNWVVKKTELYLSNELYNAQQDRRGRAGMNKSSFLSRTHASVISLRGLWFPCGGAGVHREFSGDPPHVHGLHRLLPARLHQRGRKETAGEVSGTPSPETSRSGGCEETEQGICAGRPTRCSGRSRTGGRTGISADIRSETVTTTTARKRAFRCGTPATRC